MRTRRLLLLSLTALSTGCFEVEPTTKPDAGFRDTGPMDTGLAPDTGVDAGSCLHHGPDCSSDAGLVCTRNDQCRAPTRACESTADCAEPLVCNARDHRCEIVPTGGCASDSDCSMIQHCADPGFCVPRLSEDGLLRLACAADGDCGPDGRCDTGFCAPCTTTSCGGARVCDSTSGTCVEASPCIGDDGCFRPGNHCSSMKCINVNQTCASDLNNNTQSGATPLTSAHTSWSICEDGDVDWYRFNVAAQYGARVVVRVQNPSRTRVDARLFNPEGDEIKGTSGAFRAPAITILEVSAFDGPHDVFLKIDGAGTSTTGNYTIDLIPVAFLCAGDRLDIYGDRYPSTAPFVAIPFDLDLRACPGDGDVLRFGVDSGDILHLTARTSSEGATLDVILKNGRGACVKEGDAMCRPLTVSDAETTKTWPPAPMTDLWSVTSTGQAIPSIGRGYHLVVKRDPGQGGARGMQCASPQIATAGFTRLDFDTAQDIGAPDCGFDSAPAEERDHLVRVTPPPGVQVMRATARRAGQGTGLLGIARLRNCLRDSDPVQCDLGITDTASVAIEEVLRSSDAIDLLISSGSGQVDLDITFDPADDTTCRGNHATPITASGIQLVSTIAATNTASLSASCGNLFAGAGGGPDRFYSLLVPGHERAVLELSGPDDGMLWAGLDCAHLTATCTAADSIFSLSPAVVVLTPRVSTVYLIAVDGLFEGEAGNYELKTITHAQCLSSAECAAPLRCDDFSCVPVPASDACEGAPITLVNGHATIRGSTAVANDDFTPDATCSPGADRGVPDVVYRLDLQSQVSLLHAKILSATFDTVLSINQTFCNAPHPIACNDDANSSFFSEIAVSPAGPGTYYLIVDGYSGTGAFTLSVDAQ